VSSTDHPFSCDVSHHDCRAVYWLARITVTLFCSSLLMSCL
jgi:hypothetical protein